MFSHRMALITALVLIGQVVLVACSGPATPAPSTATSAPAATSVPATATSAPATSAPPTVTSAPPTATSAPQATPTLAGETVTFQFVATLSSVEEIDDIDLLLQDIEGIVDVVGNEKSITITYDPEVISLEQLQLTMQQIGYPVKPPG